MAQITLKGNPINTSGELPKKGQKVADFRLVRTDLSEVGLKDFEGKRKVLSLFPSVDTPTCAMSVRSFNQKASERANTVVLNISCDLPFAFKRFCAAEGIENVETLSTFRDPEFGAAYGAQLVDGPLKGLLSRAIVVLNENNEVLYTEQVSEIANEPNYEAALNALNG